MHLLERLIASIAPHICLGCGDEGRLLCTACSPALPRPVRRCYRCHAADTAGRVCRSCRSSSPLRSVYPALRYEALAKQLVWALKFERAQSAASEMAERIVAAGYRPVKDCLLVPAPTARSRVRRRGYDQAALIVRSLARQYRLPYAPALIRSGSHQQHGASRLIRQQQLRQAFSVPRPAAICGRRIVLVDDVVTTGATLEAAARTLRLAGARSVDAVVFAQA